MRMSETTTTAKTPLAIAIVSGRGFGGSGDRGPGRQRMLEERAGMRSTSRPHPIQVRFDHNQDLEMLISGSC